MIPDLHIEVDSETSSGSIRLESPGGEIEVLEESQGGGGLLVLVAEQTALLSLPGASDGAGVSIVRESVDETIAIEAEPEISLIGGLQGISGLSGDGSAGTYPAAGPLGGHRAVTFDDAGAIIYADSSFPRPAQGLIRNAVAAGANVAVQKDGAMNGFSGLVPRARYFLGTDGNLTLTAPEEGIYQSVGTAATPQILIVEISQPVYL
jgi:hypothetical protein